MNTNNNSSFMNRIMNQNNEVPIYSNTLLNMLRILPDSENYSINNILNLSLYDKPKYKNVLCDKDKNVVLKEIIYNKNERYLNIECPIYQTEFKTGDKIISLPCNHCFNPEAIIKWLTEEKAECPVCRFQFNSQEIINTDTIINIDDEESGINSELANSLSRGYSLPQSNNRWTNRNINVRYNNISLISVILNEIIENEDQNILNESLINSLR